jgi:uroporphyrinogen decarboxylase
MSAKLSKRERVEAALAGEDVDRVPVSAWGHLIPAERDTRDFAEATLEFFRDYDWDWLKVNPRATYFAEGWGSEYDFDSYGGVLPRFVRNPSDPLDLGALKPVGPATKVWADHLEALKAIKKGLGGAPFVQTIFSPASALASLVGRPTDHGQEAVTRNQAETLLGLIRKSPEKVHSALAAIADSLAALAAASVEAGADGIFFAITKLARKGQLTAQEFEAFGKPYDFKVLAAVKSSKFNILHSCGPDIYWKEIQDYPVRALNWASVGQGNPGIAAARKSSSFALIGGLDELGVLKDGTPAQVRKAALEALELGGKRKFLLAPGCSIDPSVPAVNIKAFRESVGKE